MGGFGHNSELLTLVCLGLSVAIGIAFWIGRRPRISPEELERQRRLQINAAGKLIAGEIIDVNDWTIVFCYSVAGVAYTASQDASSLQEVLPENTMSLLGPASVKFDPRNPANSIVVCEGWTRAKVSERAEEPSRRYRDERQRTHAR